MEGADPGVDDPVSRDSVEREFGFYRAMPALADKNCDPLEWWAKHATTFPHLAKMAIKYLCVCATSVPSERVFSAAGNIVSDKRNCLKPGKVNQLCFLASNLNCN